MEIGPGFPPDLLSQPKETRMAYFTGLTIAHPLLVQAYERLRRAVSEATSDSLDMSKERCTDIFLKNAPNSRPDEHATLRKRG